MSQVNKNEHASVNQNKKTSPVQSSQQGGLNGNGMHNGNGQDHSDKSYITHTKTGDRSFNIVVDDVPYFVKVVPFPFNAETRYYINVNGGEDHVFTWDSQLKRLRAIDDSSWLLPDALEDVINQKLQQQK
jgi:hypothetical protein